jgi:hypothetical protein
VIDVCIRSCLGILIEEELDWINGEGKFLCISDEENVLKMAEKWSINPDKIDEINIQELGTTIES